MNNTSTIDIEKTIETSVEPKEKEILKFRYCIRTIDNPKCESDWLPINHYYYPHGPQEYDQILAHFNQHITYLKQYNRGIDMILNGVEYTFNPRQVIWFKVDYIYKE